MYSRHACYRIVTDSASGGRFCLDCGLEQSLVPAPASKYGNVSTEYAGIRYQSALEAAYARDLDLRKRAGQIRDWSRQWPVALEVNGRLVTTYRVDFRVMHNDNSVELVETKGKETEAWKIKRNLLEAVYAEELQSKRLRYTVVK